MYFLKQIQLPVKNSGISGSFNNLVLKEHFSHEGEGYIQEYIQP